MYLQFIKREFSELTPEEKYFCAIFLKNFGVDRISSLSVEGFALEFGMTTYLVTESIKSLKKHKFIRLQAITQRQARKYKATPKLKRLLEQDKEECQYKHRELIDRVLSNAPLKSKKVGKGNLKIQSRLLLVVLLLSANKFGHVKSLSRPDLQKLTGMDSDRVKSHINKLALAGYITYHLSGMTNHSLFGLCKSTYILNIDLIAGNTGWGSIAIELDGANLTAGKLYQKLRSTIHSKLEDQGMLIDRAKCMVQIESDAFANLINEIGSTDQVRLIDQAKLISQARRTAQTRMAVQTKLMTQADIKTISKVFPKSPQNELLTYIEFKHGVYVLSILHLLAAEQKAKRETIYAELQDAIQADLFPDSHVLSKYKLPSTKELRDLMVECLFDASFSAAKAIMESSSFKECYVSLSQPKSIYHLKFIDSRSVTLYFTTSHIS